MLVCLHKQFCYSTGSFHWVIINNHHYNNYAHSDYRPYCPWQFKGEFASPLWKATTYMIVRCVWYACCFVYGVGYCYILLSLFLSVSLSLSPSLSLFLPHTAAVWASRLSRLEARSRMHLLQPIREQRRSWRLEKRKKCFTLLHRHLAWVKTFKFRVYKHFCIAR